MTSRDSNLNKRKINEIIPLIVYENWYCPRMLINSKPLIFFQLQFGRITVSKISNARNIDFSETSFLYIKQYIVLLINPNMRQLFFYFSEKCSDLVIYCKNPHDNDNFLQMARHIMAQKRFNILFYTGFKT